MSGITKEQYKQGERWVKLAVSKDRLRSHGKPNWFLALRTSHINAGSLMACDGFRAHVWDGDIRGDTACPCADEEVHKVAMKALDLIQDYSERAGLVASLPFESVAVLVDLLKTALAAGEAPGTQVGLLTDPQYPMHLCLMRMEGDKPVASRMVPMRAYLLKGPNWPQAYFNPKWLLEIVDPMMTPDRFGTCTLCLLEDALVLRSGRMSAILMGMYRAKTGLMPTMPKRWSLSDDAKFSKDVGVLENGKAAFYVTAISPLGMLVSDGSSDRIARAVVDALNRQDREPN
jgi:hypothetical protein